MPLSKVGFRFIIGMIIAIIGLITYWLRVEVNPVTGAKQHVSLSPAQEISLGLRAAPRMAHEMGGELPKSDPRVVVVNQVGARLVKMSFAEKIPWQFQFHVLADDKTVNAFALPGGQIFITLGLLSKMSTEAQLAGVLGHEIGHVIERHTAEQIAKSELGQTMVIAVGTAASERSESAYAIAAVVNHILQLRYSRHDELEADKWGLRTLEATSLNPKAMVSVMTILKEASRARVGIDIFQTHPNPEQRIKDIEAYLSKHPPKAEMQSEGHRLDDLYKNPGLIGK